MRMTNKCYSSYVPWKRGINVNEISDRVASLGNDEGLKIEMEEIEGRKLKVYVNKTGLEYVLGIVYDDNKDENLIFSSLSEMQQSLLKLIEGKRILEVILY